MFLAFLNRNRLVAMIAVFAVVVCSFFLFTSNTSELVFSSTTDSVMSFPLKGDHVYFNANVITMAQGRTDAKKATGFVVKAGNIIKFLQGHHTEAYLRGEYIGARIENLKGKTVLPGFVDPHLHPDSALTEEGPLNVGIVYTPANPVTFQPTEGMTTTAQVWLAIRQAVTEAKANAKKQQFKNMIPGVWAAGYEVNLQHGEYFEFQHFETNLGADLNDIPVVISQANGHILSGNAAAFRAANITTQEACQAQDVGGAGGTFSVNANGTCTGMAFNVAMNVITAPIVKFVIATHAAKAVQGYFTWFHRVSASGITAVRDMSTGYAAGVKEADFYQVIIPLNFFPIRVSQALVSNDNAEWYAHAVYSKPGESSVCPSKLKWAAKKYWSDGSSPGETGAMRAPYYNAANPNITAVFGTNWTGGAMGYNLTTLVDGFTRDMNSGFQIVTHVNGDRSMDLVLQATQQAYKNVANEKKARLLRNRLEHVPIIRPDHIGIMKSLDLNPSFLAGHLYYWGDVFAYILYGPEVMKDFQPAREFVDTAFSVHSDNSVSPSIPLLAVQTLVTRTTKDGTVIGANHAVSVEDALRAVTTSAAYMAHLEETSGSLRLHKPADFVILSEDPFQVEPSSIGNIQVERTVMAGETRFPLSSSTQTEISSIVAKVAADMNNVSDKASFFDAVLKALDSSKLDPACLHNKKQKL